ncbi:TPA: DUF3800 domain-containing protein [Pasteurella multocida]
MFFYIDESGNTGLNLCDKSQPYLYYGVLSSSLNIDLTVVSEIKEIQESLSVDRFHANELGINKLSEISVLLVELIKNYDLKFDLFILNKSDYIIISFFDQVFDQGVNPAVPWFYYWTPLRYHLLFQIAYLFDDELLDKAWTARITKKQQTSDTLLIDVCRIILERSKALPDLRIREVISNALTWAINNVSNIYYNGSLDKNSQLQISPNLIAFQTVLFGIVHRSNLNNSQVNKVIVDQQSQFNNAQKWLTKLYQKTDDILSLGIGLPEIDFRNMFKTSIECMSGNSSMGLQIVDLFLWIFKRKIEGRKLSAELENVFNILSYDSAGDEISLKALFIRWSEWFNALPKVSEISKSHLLKIKRIRKEEDKKIKELMSSYR